jgi:hypothetical protein
VQAQSIESEDALQMSEEHLDLLSLPARDDVGLRLGDCARLVASGYMNGARDLACRRVRAARGLKRAGLAVVLARELASCLLSSPRHVVGRTSDDISSAPCRQGKHSGCLLDRRRSRCVKTCRPCAPTCRTTARAVDPELVDQPPQDLGQSIARLSRQTGRGDFELIGGAVDHRLGRPNLRLAQRCRRLDVHDHRMLQVDEGVVGIGVDGGAVGRAGITSRGSVGEIDFGSTRVAPPKAASSRTDKYSATARLDVGSCSTVSPTAATLSNRKRQLSFQEQLGESRQTRKGETSELDERLTPKPSSSRVSSRWKSRVKSQRKSTRTGLAVSNLPPPQGQERRWLQYRLRAIRF